MTIEREENNSKLRAFLDDYKSGTNYALGSKMRQDAWASEVEIISLALLTSKNAVCYYNENGADIQLVEMKQTQLLTHSTLIIVLDVTSMQ